MYVDFYSNASVVILQCDAVVGNVMAIKLLLGGRTLLSKLKHNNDRINIQYEFPATVIDVSSIALDSQGRSFWG